MTKEEEAEGRKGFVREIKSQAYASVSMLSAKD